MFSQYYQSRRRLSYNVEVLVGLPASGKSTYAKKKHSNGYAVISKDDIRLRCCQDLYEEYSAPETFFTSAQLHRFSPACNTIINSVCEHLEKLLNGKICTDAVLADNMLKKQYNEDELMAINRTFDFYIRELKNNDAGVIFDATYYTKKSRKMFIAKFAGKTSLKAVYFHSTLEEAIKNNEQRKELGKTVYHDEEYYGRRVPDDVLRNMYCNLTIPTVEEGFDSVHYPNNSLYVKENQDKLAYVYNNIENMTVDEVARIFPVFTECINFQQDNVHHKLDLATHMLECAKYVKKHGGSMTAVIASLLHDLGKIETKGFYGRLNREYVYKDKIFKADKELEILADGDVLKCKDPFTKMSMEVPNDYIVYDSDAHYYSHHIASALKAWRSLINMADEKFVKEVYWLIYEHMSLPFHGNKLSQKKLNNLIAKVGYEGVRNLALIRQGDLYAKDCIRVPKDELIEKLVTYDFYTE